MKLMKRLTKILCVVLVLQFGVMFSVVNAACWKEGESYKAGEIVTYNGKDYKCLVNHTAWEGSNWTPLETPSLWEVIGESSHQDNQENGVINENNETAQQDNNAVCWKEGESYKAGEIVTYNGKEYKCLANHTAWEGTNWNPSSTPTLWEEVGSANNMQNQNEGQNQGQNEEQNQGQNEGQNQEEENIPIVESKGEWGEKVYAPYVDVMLWPTPSINSFMEATGNKYYTLAFILSNGGKPAWGGITPYNQGFYKEEISKLRKNGGDVIVSFGGANGIELALEVTDVDKLKKAYQDVIDEYQLTWVDFDIEGFAVSDKASVQRRNQAIAKLQKDNPDLTIAYCLPVMPEGLTQDGLYVLKDAKEKGVNIDVVNIMTMDYGPSYQGDMGQYAIEAAKNTEKQIRNIGLGAKLGNTPMIGQNDVSVEKFTVDDAKKVLKWAKENDNVRLLSMWSVTRDKSKGTGLYNCSMIPQEDFEFTDTFKEFNG